MKHKRVALIGNANVGKTTIFNSLCGLTQKTGNYPGVTIDKTKGYFIEDGVKVEITDLPGFSSLTPTSADEELVVKYLLESKPLVDEVLYVANAHDLKKSLYLFSQIKDLGFSCLLVLNMSDVALKKGIVIDIQKLSAYYKVPVILVSARKKIELSKLKKQIIQNRENKSIVDLSVFAKEEEHEKIRQYAQEINQTNYYKAFLELAKADKTLRIKEPILRYQFITKILSEVQKTDLSLARDITSKLDSILLHKVWGYVVFVFLLFLVFQGVFWLASYPMEWIDMGLGWTKDSLSNTLPKGMLSDLLVGGVLEGLGGVIIFIPQIVILFMCFSIMEESGYMSRVVFLMDRIMQKIGMSGKSVVPIVGSFACAVPSILSTRTIENQKERLITILVSPLITCSARIPVYTVIIAIIIPNESWLGFNLQGLVLLGMYILGVVMMVIGAMVFKYIIKTQYKSFFIIEIPPYLIPDFKSVAFSVWNNSKAFVWNAGKVIVAVTIIIFVLQSNGNSIYRSAEAIAEKKSWSYEEKIHAVAQVRDQNSYLAVGGKFIEPVIEPLGYDWKVGIGVLASIAAREVFVGTMMVVYGGNEDESEENQLVIQKLGQQINHNTGKRTFNFATGISLLLFYAFSLQCISTIAVTYKETRSLKWTSIQFLYMTGLAYISALIAYQFLS